MNQMTKTLKTADIASQLSLPKKGDIVSGVNILDIETKLVNNVFKYRITFPKGTRRGDMTKLLREFFSVHMITINGEDHVVNNHDYQTRPMRNHTILSGNLEITPLSKTNPKLKKKLTALEDFDYEYSKMEMETPESYFNVYPYSGFNGPKFRSKLFSFVSRSGENYGYTDGKKLYYRRASLVMPKIKITKAPPNANMFYHTHPKKD